MSNARSVVSSVFLVLLCTSFAWAQLDTGTLSGTVTDQTGATVPGAAVNIKHVETGISRSLQTNEAGRYEAVALPGGTYEVTASLPGFQTLVRGGIVLTVGRNAVVDMSLRLGDVTDTITITAETSQVETTTATVTQLINERKVLDIPLNNRDLTQLAFFDALVMRTPTGGGGGRNAAGGLGDHLSVAGMRGSNNMYLLDGVSNGDFTNNAQSATTGYVGAETVKEFQVITNNYSAEYQSKPGAIVSAVTKSGTNAFHGSLFEFLRNDNMDAYNWATKARGGANPVKPEFKRNQFGGSLGGPIIRNKTFFFTSYEGTRERKGETLPLILPTARGRIGLLAPNRYDSQRPERFNRAEYDAGITPIKVDPRAVPYLGLLPLPGQGGTVLLEELRDPVTGLLDGFARVSGPRSNVANENFGAVKIDHQFANQRKGSIAFTYNVDRSDHNLIDPIPGLTSAVGERSDKTVISLRHTSILSPTMLNEFAFGFNRSEPAQSFPNNEPDWKNFNGADLRFVKTRERMGQLNFGDGVAAMGFPRDRALFFQDFYTYRNNLSITRTNHTFKIGAEYNPIRLVMDQVGGSYNAVYQFDTFHAFLTADPRQVEADLPADFPLPNGQIHQAVKVFYWRQKQFGAYFQDNWKLRPSFTLNLGMRYEFMTIPKEDEGRVSNLLRITDPVPTIGPNIMFNNPTKKNFSPRFGFAWAPGGTSQSAIRGGFGIYYDLPGPQYWRSHSQENVPFVVAGFFNRSDAIRLLGPTASVNFPNAVQTQTALLAQVPSYRLWELNNKPSYVYRWSLSLERQFGRWFGQIAYNGSAGRHLYTQADANQAKWIGYPNMPGPGQEMQWAPTPTNILGDAINPAFANIWVIAPRGSSYYNGISLSAQRRVARGLQFQTAYNFSKNIDYGSGSSNQQDNLPQNQRINNYWDWGRTKGLSQLNVKHNFVSNFVYDLPQTGRTGVIGTVLNGWQVNGVLSLSSGTPFTVTDANTAQTNAMRRASLTPNLAANGNHNPVTGNPDAWFDVNNFVPSVCRAGVYCIGNTPGTANYNPGLPSGATVPRPDLGYQVGFIGNIARNTVVGPGLATFDFSTTKNFNITESQRVQFRAEFFNLTNHPNFRIPNSALFNANGTRNVNAGRVDTTRSPERQIQFGLKYVF
ncbi:MAG TPA: TonB-dependent receptor [Terriglobia bacterium]|nr:TonB-dependent receptor [Terriglobia bacterium]